MALTVDWENRIVHIPQSDLTPTTNPNVYTLDVETFRWWIMAIQESEEGIIYPDIITHSTSVELSGITYARFIEIVNGYTITFEDVPAQSYGVILSGANHNIIDVNNYNTTSLLGNNSAGLIYNDVGELGDVNVTSIGGVPVTDPSDVGAQPDVIASEILNTDVTLFTGQDTVGQAIWRARFLKASIYVDTNALVNGDGSQEQPFDNINDAVTMSNTTHIWNIVVSGAVVIPADFKNKNVYGVGLPNINLNGQDATGSMFEKVAVQGAYIGSIESESCTLKDGFSLNGRFQNCTAIGDLNVLPNATVLLATCGAGVGLDNSVINMPIANPSSVSVSGWRGGLTINDCDHLDDVITVDIAQGTLTLANSCIAGTMVARGLGDFIDESNGTLVIDEMTYEKDIVNAVNNDGRKTRNTVIATS